MYVIICAMRVMSCAWALRSGAAQVQPAQELGLESNRIAAPVLDLRPMQHTLQSLQVGAARPCSHPAPAHVPLRRRRGGGGRQGTRGVGGP